MSPTTAEREVPVSSPRPLTPLPAGLDARTRREEEDNREQACALATVTLAYDPETNRVLRGPYRGLPVDAALDIEVEHLREVYPYVVVRFRTLRPWWRLWRPTPAVIVRPAHLLEGVI